MKKNCVKSRSTEYRANSETFTHSSYSGGDFTGAIHIILNLNTHENQGYAETRLSCHHQLHTPHE